MYKEFYGLQQEPFSIAPDPDFLYWSQKHQEAFRHLLYSIRRKQGIILLTGDIGVGKTTLVNALIRELNEKSHIAYISNTLLNTHELFQYISYKFRFETKTSSKIDYLIQLNKFLLKSHADHKDVILILDEAQNFSIGMLEEIRLLSNEETEKEKLLQIILVGQKSLLHKINTPDLSQLKQRIGIGYHLRPLNLFETKLYIQNRLEVSGSQDTELFHTEALEEISRYTKGVPRMINIMCDHALLFGVAEQSRAIDARMIKQVAESIGMNGVVEPDRTSHPAPGPEESADGSGAGGTRSMGERGDNGAAKNTAALPDASGEGAEQRVGWLMKVAIIVALLLLFGVLLVRGEVFRRSLATVPQTISNFLQGTWDVGHIRQRQSPVENFDKEIKDSSAGGS